jgi:DHA1 family multidrug resistance protein-like MFS transporter
MTQAMSGMSLYLFGIAFAPIWTPHVTERTGRSLVYLCSLPICGIFLIGAGLSHNFAGVAICRFLAGASGGPCLVLIEGTFADIWSAETTNTYYAFLGTAAYIGAACGPIAGGYVASAFGWRWTQYLSCIIIAAVLLFGMGMSETYQREIPRRRARRAGRRIEQEPAQSGVTASQMARVTILDPIRMLFTDPIVGLISVVLIFNFAIVFQWFVTVPAVLASVYGFDLEHIGLAFTTAIVGAVMAAACNIAIEQISTGRLMKQHRITMAQSLEYRLVPAMIGQFLVTGSLFWIGKHATSWHLTAAGRFELTNTIRRLERHAADIIPDSSHWYCSLRLGQRHDHLLARPLSLRRVPASRDSIGTHGGCIWTYSICRCTAACDSSRLYWSWGKLGLVFVWLHVDRSVACSVRAIQIW